MKSIVFLRNSEIIDDVFSMDMSNGLTTNITTDPSVRDGWPVFDNNGKWIYYSSMAEGLFNIYRIKPDGSSKEIITKAKPGEEDARAFVSADGSTLIYNKRLEGRIDINTLLLTDLP